MKDVVVIGIGNILQRDDGMGVHVVKQLENEGLPSTIELVDGGTATLSLLSYFMKYKKIIIIDSLKGGLAPGTIYDYLRKNTHYVCHHYNIKYLHIMD